MNDRRVRLFDRFDALSQRERLLVGLTLVVVLLFAWWVMVYQELMPEIRSLHEAEERQHGELLALQAIRDGIRQRLNEGVHREQQQRIEALRKELSGLRRQLDEGTRDLVPPREMFDLMQQMIEAAPRLKLVELKRNAVEPLFRTGKGIERKERNKQPERNGEQPALYRHVMELRLLGEYGDILRWLQRLERLPWRLMWNRVELRVQDWPRIEVTLILSTVSRQRAWVGL